MAGTQIDPQRRAALLAIKLGALVRDHAGEAPAEKATFALGSALLRDGEAWILADETPIRSLGPSLAWARQQGATAVHLLAESCAGVLARRASQFSYPIHVYAIDGRVLAPAEPDPPIGIDELDARLAHLVEVIVAGGAEPLVEHGVLVGEVNGLEVCRAVIDPYIDVVRLEVGVGAHDREAFTLMHGDIPTVEALAGVVNAVAECRTLEAPWHPLNRLARERLLRIEAIRDPARIGARELQPEHPPVKRENVKDVVPAVASGVDADGRPLLAVFSNGIDLDLIPFAADARLRDQRDDVRLVVVVPPRDDSPVTRALASWLIDPLDIVTFDEAGSTAE